MKLRYILTAIASGVLLLAGCTHEYEISTLDQIKVSQSYISIPVSGNATVVTLDATTNWELTAEEQADDVAEDGGNFVYNKVDLPEWLTVTPTSGDAGRFELSFSAGALDDPTAGREANLVIRVLDENGNNTGIKQHLIVRQGEIAASAATCQEVIDGPDGKTYIVTGTCTSIGNTQYGNWYLNDGTGELYIYGTVDATGQYNWDSFNIEVGDIVTITAQTNTGYTWVGWYEGDMLLTNEAEYSFEMTGENHIYTAKWIKINLTVNNSLAGTVTGLSDAYKVGDNATVTAASNSGYIWVGWYNGEELLTRAKEYTFSMPSESATYTASWIKITLNKNISAGGTVSGLEGDNLSYGDNTVVTATSNLGYEWLGWYNGDELVSTLNAYSFAIGEKAMTLTAKWEVKPEMAMFVFSSSDSYCSITGVKDASSVTAVHIPSYVTDVSSRGFKNCHDIATITAEAGNARYRAEGNCLIDLNYDRVVLGCKNSVIPTSSDVTSIGEAAFFARYGLTSIFIPKNIISMSASSPDEGQFAYCEDLTSVECEVDLKLGIAPDHLPNIFMGCTKLSRFTMTGSNSRYYTVDNCIMYRPTAWGQTDHELILASNPSSIPAAASVISSNAFVLCSEMTSLVVPDTVKKIEQGAFSGMSGLNEITVPFVGRDADGFTADDKYRGPYLFGYVFGTKSWSYDNSIAVVQYGMNQDPLYKYTYYMPKGLTKVTLTNGSVETNGFNNWKNLKELVGVVRLSHGALRNCTGITSIDLSNCQYIDSYALSGTSITTVTVP